MRFAGPSTGHYDSRALESQCRSHRWWQPKPPSGSDRPIPVVRYLELPSSLQPLAKRAIGHVSPLIYPWPFDRASGK
jgi:hypothetical protein